MSACRPAPLSRNALLHHPHTQPQRRAVKALPWHTTVRKLLEDKSQWGLFMPLAGCMPSPGNYVCGPDATHNLYHDFEQTPSAFCLVADVLYCARSRTHPVPRRG